MCKNEKVYRAAPSHAGRVPLRLLRKNMFVLVPLGAYRFSGLPWIKKTKNKSILHKTNRCVYDSFYHKKNDVFTKMRKTNLIMVAEIVFESLSNIK